MLKRYLEFLNRLIVDKELPANAALDEINTLVLMFRKDLGYTNQDLEFRDLYPVYSISIPSQEAKMVPQKQETVGHAV